MSVGIAILIFIIVLICFILFSGFISAIETAYTSISEVAWKLYLQNYPKPKISLRLANFIKQHYAKTVGMSLLINNVLAIGAGLFASDWLHNYLGLSLNTSSITSLILVTLLLVFFGDFFPKNLALKINFKFVVYTAYPVFFLWILCYPLTFWMGLFFKKKPIATVSKELIDDLTEVAYDDKVMDQYEAELVSSALDLDNKSVKDFMTKAPVVGLQHATIYDLMQLYVEHQYTRVVILDQNKEVYGVLNYKLLWALMVQPDGSINSKKIKIDDAIQEALFIDKNTKLDEAMRMMQNFNTHMGVVIDLRDKQKMVGVITIEDILEELVGEIYDENDDNADIQKINDFHWVINPNASSSQVVKILNIKHNLFITKSMKAKDFFIQHFKTENLVPNNTYESKDLILKVGQNLDDNKIAYFVTKKEINQPLEEKMKLTWKSFFKKTSKIDS